MRSNARKLYEATQILFRAFHYLYPRMRGGALAPPEPMNPEALAGCILHGCMSRVVREIQVQREQAALHPLLRTRTQQRLSSVRGYAQLDSSTGWSQAEGPAGWALQSFPCGQTAPTRNGPNRERESAPNQERFFTLATISLDGWPAVHLIVVTALK